MGCPNTSNNCCCFDLGAYRHSIAGRGEAPDATLGEPGLRKLHPLLEAFSDQRMKQLFLALGIGLDVAELLLAHHAGVEAHVRDPAREVGDSFGVTKLLARSRNVVNCAAFQAIK